MWNLTCIFEIVNNNTYMCDNNFKNVDKNICMLPHFPKILYDYLWILKKYGSSFFFNEDQRKRTLNLCVQTASYQLELPPSYHLKQEPPYQLEEEP